MQSESESVQGPGVPPVGHHLTDVQAVIDSAKARGGMDALERFIRHKLPEAEDEEIVEAAGGAGGIVDSVPVFMARGWEGAGERGLTSVVGPLLSLAERYFREPVDLIPEMTQGLAGLLDDTYLVVRVLEHLDKGMRIVEPIMGVAHWKPELKVDAEEVTVTFERGVPVALNGKRLERMIDVVLEANRIGGRHGMRRMPGAWQRAMRPRHPAGSSRSAVSTICIPRGSPRSGRAAGPTGALRTWSASACAIAPGTAPRSPASPRPRPMRRVR